MVSDDEGQVLFDGLSEYMFICLAMAVFFYRTCLLLDTAQ